MEKVLIPIYNDYPYRLCTIEVYKNCVDWVNMAIRDYWLKHRLNWDSKLEAEELFMKQLKGIDRKFSIGLNFLPEESVPTEINFDYGEVIDGKRVIPFDFHADQFVGVPNPDFSQKDPVVDKLIKGIA